MFVYVTACSPMNGPAWPYYRLISVYTDYRLVPLLPDTWSNLNTTCDSLGGQLQWFDATDDLYHLQDQWRVFDGLSNGQYFTGEKLTSLMSSTRLVRRSTNHGAVHHCPNCWV